MTLRQFVKDTIESIIAIILCVIVAGSLMCIIYTFADVLNLKGLLNFMF